jgi:hypothetical protein
LSFRDATAPDVVIAYDGISESYRLATQEDVLQWFPSFLPEGVQEQQQGAFSYDDRPKSVSQPVSFENWSGGCGVVDDDPGTTRTNVYSYSRGVDPSWGQLILSPQRQTATGIAVAPTKFYRSPTYGYFCLTASAVYRLVAGEWANVYTPAAAPTDIIEYGNSTATYLFLAMGDSTDMVYTTNSFTTTTTVMSERGSFFTVRGSTSVEPVLFCYKANGLARSSVNPVLSSNWSNEDQIGSRGQTVANVVTANDKMWVLKEEGIWTFDGTTIDTIVSTDLLKRAGNGSKVVERYDGHIYTNYGNRVIKIDPFDETVSRVWAPSHPELNGKITALAADLRYLYIFTQNAEGNTYLVKKDILVDGNPHTIAYLGAVDVNAAVVVAANVGALSTTNDNLVFGYGAAGGYFILPRDGYRPWEDTNCRYDTAGGTLYGSWVDVGAATYEKWLNGGRLLTLDSSGAKSVAVSYGLDGSSSTTALVTGNAPGLQTARVTTDGTFTRIRYAVTLSTGGSNTTPRMQALVFDCTPNPPRNRAWSFTVDLGDQSLKHANGTRSGDSFEALLSHLEGAVGKRATFTDYFGSEYTAKVVNVGVQGIKKTGIGTGRAGSSRSLVTVAAIEIAENLVVTNPFVWGAASGGAGGTKWSSNYSWAA